MYSSMTRLFGTNFCRTCEFSTDNQLIRGFRGGPFPLPWPPALPPALAACPFPLRWPPDLAARSASVLIRINEFLFCIRTIVTPTPYNLTLQKLHQNSCFTIYSLPC